MSRDVRTSEWRICSWLGGGPQQHSRAGETFGGEEKGERDPTLADLNRVEQGLSVLRRSSIQSFRVSYGTRFSLSHNSLYD